MKSRRNGTEVEFDCRRNGSRRNGSRQNGTNHRRNGSRRNGGRRNGSDSPVHCFSITLIVFCYNVLFSLVFVCVGYKHFCRCLMLNKLICI